MMIVEEKGLGLNGGIVLWGWGQGGKSSGSSRGSKNVCSKGLSDVGGTKSRERTRSL